MKFQQFLLLIIAALFAPAQSFSQGSLVPPGPPGPTMKSLGQIEPRTPISALPFVIDQAGSYYLTTNLTASGAQHGLAIQADDVTIDLNGFALIGSPAALAGIHAAGSRQNITVKNGTIRNWKVGITATNATLCHFESLRVANNREEGMSVGANSKIIRCAADSNEGVGLRASRETFIEGCSARGNLSHGFETGPASEIKSCTASFNSGHGFLAGENSRMEDCTALQNAGSGLVTGPASQVKGAMASKNGAHGVLAGDQNIIQNTLATLSGGTGIVAGTGAQLNGCSTSGNSANGIQTGEQSTVDDCNATQNRADGLIAGANSQIQRCQSFQNTKSGFTVDRGSTVSSCTAQRNGGHGIVVSAECLVQGNNCNNNFNARDAAGIHATGTDNRITENNLISNDRGLSVAAGGNLIFKNSAANNSINYFINGSQTLGPIVQGPGPIDSANPWVNFEF